MDDNIGEIIATRELELNGKPVLVTIGKPQPFPNSADYRCPWRIDGLEAGPVQLSAGGVDAVQSLIFALSMVGARLGYAGQASELTFLGSSKLGFLVHRENGIVMDR